MTGNHPMGNALILFTLLMVTGPISGGHLNPAVTTAVFVIKYKEWKVFWFVLYLIAEYLGGILGILLASISKGLQNGGTDSFPKLKPGNGSGTSPITAGACWFTEFFCTFWFVAIIMHAKESRLTSNFKNTLLFILSIAIAFAGVI